MDRCIWCNIILTPDLYDTLASNFCIVCNRHMDIAFAIMANERETFGPDHEIDEDTVDRLAYRREFGICRMFA